MSGLSTLGFQIREGIGLAWPLMLGSCSILLVAGIVMRRDRRALWLLGRGVMSLVVPWSLPLWATLTAGVEKGGHAPFPWASLVLFALSIGSLGFAVTNLYRGRRHWYVFLPIAITVAYACFLGAFVGGMQIVDDWV